MGDPGYLASVDLYLADCARRRLRPATLRYYRMVLLRFVAVTRITQLTDLAAGSVRSFQDGTPNLSAGSMRGFVRALKTFSSWASDELLLPMDPLARLKLPRADRRVVAVPSDDELVRTLAAAGPQLRVVIGLFAGTGLRVGDLVGLQLSDVRPGELVVGKSKNRAGRLVPIDPVVDGLARAYIAELRASVTQALFVSRTGRPLTADAVRHALTDCVGRSGLDLRIGPHVLRHWYARDLAGHGASDRLLSARMGWMDHGLTGRYAPVALAELKRDVARYAPLVRLRDEGRLDGLFPARMLFGPAAQRSKYVGRRTGSIGVRGRVARHS
jgi:site-specific recombinase XerD